MQGGSDNQGTLDALLERVAPATAHLGRRSRSLASLGVIVFLLALVWALVIGVASRRLELLIPAGALVLLAIVLWVAAAVSDMSATPAAGGTDQPSGAEVAPGGRLLIGCWLGRRSVACGAIAVSGERPGLPSGERISEVVAPRIKRLDPEQRGTDAIFDELVSAIVETMRAGQTTPDFDRFSAIGIATPGIVDAASGSLSLSVTFPGGTNIADEVARRLFDEAGELLRSTFGADVATEGDLRTRIYVDNDVRCIARHELSDNGWREFTTLYVGSGIGAALVFCGEVYHGAHGSAGHIGHVELEGTGEGLKLTTGQRLAAVKCDCGVTGFHFEPFANDAGLGRITETIATDPARADAFAAIKAHFATEGGRREDFYRNRFAPLVAVAGRPHEHLPTSLQPLFERYPDVRQFANDVLDAYVAVLARGIGTLMNVVDSRRITLCGPLLEELGKNDGFWHMLRQTLPQHVLGFRAQPEWQRTSATDALWKGAALLAWDPAYHRRRHAPGS